MTRLARFRFCPEPIFTSRKELKNRKRFFLFCTSCAFLRLFHRITFWRIEMIKFFTDPD